MDFSNYLFRCHMVGNIISVPKPLSKTDLSILDRIYTKKKNNQELTEVQLKDWHRLESKKEESKTFKLSDGQKKLLRQLHAFESRGVRLFNGSVQTQKGLFLEKEIRDILSIESGIFLTESKERKQNKWVSGITDFDTKELSLVPDIKAAWSLLSFNNILEEEANELYLRQLDSYMELEGKDEGLLIHVLLDTPLGLIERDVKMILNNPAYTTIGGELTDEGFEVMQSLIYNHTFTEKGIEEIINCPVRIYNDEYFEFEESFFKNFKEKPLSERIHMIPHSFDKERIHQRNECISLAREYMSSIQPINNFNINLLNN